MPRVPRTHRGPLPRAHARRVGARVRDARRVRDAGSGALGGATAPAERRARRVPRGRPAELGARLASALAGARAATLANASHSESKWQRRYRTAHARDFERTRVRQLANRATDSGRHCTSIMRLIALVFLCI